MLFWSRKLSVLCFCIVLVAACSQYVIAKKCEHQPGKMEEGRKCRKSCKTDKDCKGTKKKCICDNVCGLSCFNPDATCDEISIENGDVIGNLTYDSEIKYVCKDGYRLEGNPKRKCQSDREWSGTQPTCVKRECKYPPRVSFAYPNAAKGFFNKGDIVTYSCRYGYIMSGNPNVTCQGNNRWSPRNFLCEKLSCGDPGAPINGKFEAEDFLFGTWALYKCNEGYELSNPRQNRRLCSSTGTWSGSIPTCIIKTCPAPKNPENGKALALRFEFRSVVEYTCHKGYKLEGNERGFCNDNGDWGEVPACKVDINCDFDSSSRPFCGYSDSGEVKWKRKYLREGTKSTLPSYVISFNPSMLGKTAELSSPSIPSTIPHCLQFYYRIEKHVASKEDFTVRVRGKTITYIIQSTRKWPVNRWVGYQMTIQSNNDEDLKFDIVAKGGTTIEIDELKVVKNECEGKCLDPNPCKNRGICLDEITTYTCSCTDYFTGRNCEREIVCEKPKNVDFLTVTGKEKIKFREKISFSCDDGYDLVGSSSAQCRNDGTWSEETPSCIKKIVYQGTCPSNYKLLGFMCFRFDTNPTTYVDAKKQCESEGGRLATVQSRSVESFIWNNLPSGYRDENLYWLGLTSQTWQRKWSTGLKFEEVLLLNYNLRNQGANECGAYHYKGRGTGDHKWEIVWRPCGNSHRYICEQWSKEASSYHVQSFDYVSGIYKPIAGIMHQSRQVYSRTKNGQTYHLFYHQENWRSYGWILGRFSVRETRPESTFLKSRSSAKNPDEITEQWVFGGRDVYNVKITQIDWWRSWSSWSKCSVTCGQGKEIRTRQCTGSRPGSMECKGSSNESRQCRLIECPREETQGGKIKYVFRYKLKTRKEAESDCATIGGQLAIVKTKQLTNRFKQRIKADINQKKYGWPPSFYINIRREANTTHWWRHGDNEQFQTNNVEGGIWVENQPDDKDKHGRPEDCIEISNRGWNDVSCENRLRSICEIVEKTPCSPNPCKNNGFCRDNGESYTCQCNNGFKGKICDEPDKDAVCDPNPCKNEANCRTQGDSYFCFCRNGFSGTYCERSDKEPSKLPTPRTTGFKTPTQSITREPFNQVCDSAICNGRGECRMTQNDYSCECTAGFYGKHCGLTTTTPQTGSTTVSLAPQTCPENFCNGHGSCRPGPEEHVCFCSTGFSGKNCEFENPCKWKDITASGKTFNVKLTKLDGSTIKDDNVSKGTKLRITCPSDSQVVVGENVITCEGGNKWSRNARVTCSALEQVCTLKEIPKEFDVYDASDRELHNTPLYISSGDSIFFKCSTPGKNARITITCVKNEWDNYIPISCDSQTYCRDLEKVKNGKYEVTVGGNHQNPPFLPGDKVRFSCDSFHVLNGPKEITCLPNGEWSSEPSKCKDAGCFLFLGELGVGVDVRGFEGNFQVDKGSKYTLYCKNGKEREIVCEGRDTWNPPYVDFTC